MENVNAQNLVDSMKSPEAAVFAKDFVKNVNPFATIDDFAKIDLRVGKVVEAIVHPDPKSTRLLVLKVDLGDLGIRTICAGIREHYSVESLVGQSIMVVANLAPRVMRGVESQGMLLAVHDSSGVKVVNTPDVAAGTKVG